MSDSVGLFSWGVQFPQRRIHQFPVWNLFTQDYFLEQSNERRLGVLLSEYGAHLVQFHPQMNHFSHFGLGKGCHLALQEGGRVHRNLLFHCYLVHLFQPQTPPLPSQLLLLQTMETFQCSVSWFVIGTLCLYLVFSFLESFNVFSFSLSSII